MIKQSGEQAMYLCLIRYALDIAHEIAIVLVSRSPATIGYFFAFGARFFHISGKIESGI